MVIGYEAKLHLGICKFGHSAKEVISFKPNIHEQERNSLLESLIKRLFIQKYVVILELFVEAVLHLFHAEHNTIDIGVAGCANYHE